MADSDKFGNETLDLRSSWRKDGDYTLPGRCSNCGWTGTLILSRGSRAPRLHGPSYNCATCERCGCKAIGATP